MNREQILDTILVLSRSKTFYGIAHAIATQYGKEV